MKIAFYGSSLVSSYWNGAATYYRGLLSDLARRGHRIAFYEPDAFDRQKHRDIDPPEVVADVLAQLGLPARQIVEAAQSEANKLALRAQTEEAAARGIFGAPTFFVGDEMFWGNDRLDDALELCEALRAR